MSTPDAQTSRNYRLPSLAGLVAVLAAIAAAVTHLETIADAARHLVGLENRTADAELTLKEVTRTPVPAPPLLALTKYQSAFVRMGNDSIRVALRDVETLKNEGCDGHSGLCGIAFNRSLPRGLAVMEQLVAASPIGAPPAGGLASMSQGEWERLLKGMSADQRHQITKRPMARIVVGNAARDSLYAVGYQLSGDSLVYAGAPVPAIIYLDSIQNNNKVTENADRERVVMRVRPLGTP